MKCESSYYQSARSIVWSNGGILLRFIGDAVLAIFNYPTPTAESYRNSVQCAVQLIDLGHRQMSKLRERMDDDIETGTRVGMSCGQMVVLDIGVDSVEAELVGDMINKASRLEKACEANGITMTQTLYRALERSDQEFADDLGAIEDRLDPSEAKGQTHSLIIWRVPPRYTWEPWDGGKTARDADAAD